MGGDSNSNSKKRNFSEINNSNNNDGGREDGRSPTQIRDLAIEVGIQERADGSCKFTQGNTVVLASVRGPGDVSASKEKYDRTTIEVIWRAKSGVASSIKHRRKEQLLRHILEILSVKELHPRSTIQLVLQEIHDDGALLACAVNAACVALMDAGISMRHCAAAVELVVNKDGGLLLDPLLAEEKDASASLTFAFTNNAQADASLIMSECNGKHSYKLYEAALQSAHEASMVLFSFYRKSAERRLR